LSCLLPPSWPTLNLLAAQSAGAIYPVVEQRQGSPAPFPHYYGKKIGNLITTLYFIAFFVVVQIYAVAITNSLTEQLAKHLTVDTAVRVLVSLGWCWF
jgi:amino acid permease